MKAYKLFRELKSGDISSLFINKKKRLPFNVWLCAESHPTKGYTYRPYWHCTQEPKAPHLTEKDRVWCLVEIEDFEVMHRPKFQGGTWYLANKMKILEKIHLDK
jgi:hypothetical protein